MRDNNQKQNNPNKEKPSYPNAPSAPNKNPNQREQEKKFRQGDRNSGCGC